jgi:GAF domain-containing protein
MTSPDYAPFLAAVALRGAQPRAAFDALCALTERHVGVKLFTLMTRDPFEGWAERIYSNRPEAYPVSGRKPANRTRWSEEVIERRQIFVANDIAAIAEVFPDHALIRSLGCESVINVPVEIDGEVVGTINCLHEAGFYTPARVAAAQALKLPGAVCFLLARRG